MISFIIMTKKQLSQLFLIHISETDSACQSTNMGALSLLFFCVRISDVYFFFLFSPESKTFVVAQGTLNCLIVLLLEMTI